METTTIDTKEYDALKVAKRRLEALSNMKVKQRHITTGHPSFADLVGVLGDVPGLRGKTSVEVQHMIPAVWSGKHS